MSHQTYSPNCFLSHQIRSKWIDLGRSNQYKQRTISFTTLFQKSRNSQISLSVASLLSLFLLHQGSLCCFSLFLLDYRKKKPCNRALLVPLFSGLVAGFGLDSKGNSLPAFLYKKSKHETLRFPFMSSTFFLSCMH